ncbi:unnamed protein product, partial [Rotaria sp. Silwood1]
MNNSTFFEISKIKSDQFFNLTEEMTSDIEVEILKAQGINNIPSLLRAQDLFSLFKIDCEELQDLRTRACLRLKSGEYMIRPAIKENLDYCINVLKNKLHEQQPHVSQNQNQNSNTHPSSFVNTFINNMSDNMNRSKYRYQYNESTRRFASSVYALGGQNVYQLLRLNLPGAFPSIPTIESYNNEYCTRIEEGEFRFDQLNDSSKNINCSYAYASEDCTGVISKIQYDAESNSFVGFCSELRAGIPMLRQYQTDDFLELEEWFETFKKSTLVNLHTVQPITSIGSPPFLLSSFGTDNHIDSVSIIHRWLFILEECKKRNIRIVGFSSDADSKYLKAMRLATESNVTSGGIKFPKHHKQNQSNAFSSILINLNELTLDNIEKNIYDAYEYAKSFAEKLGMSSLLKTKNVFQLNDLSLNIRNDLEKIIYLNDDSTLDNDDNSDSGDEENYYSLASDVEDDNENEESETENECTQSTKDVFNGMRIYSTVADKDKNKFFKIEINNKIKYIHKQTAVWYLTNNNNRLSSDRL